MSLHGLITFSGARCSSTRLTQSRDTLGAVTGTTAAVLVDEPIYVERISGAVAHRQFGTETEATMLGVMEAGLNLRLGDVLTITGGAYDGTVVRVVEEHELPTGPKHTVLGLQVVPAGTAV